MFRFSAEGVSDNDVACSWREGQLLDPTVNCQKIVKGDIDVQGYGMRLKDAVSMICGGEMTSRYRSSRLHGLQ